ncbi:MAG: hypothetical protein AAF724_12915 [Pseudomonadota bacterium]
MEKTNSKLEAMLDLHGADLNRWPDADAAQEARKAALSDSAFRAQLDAARKIDKRFEALSKAIDRSPIVDAGIANMENVLLAHVEAHAERRRAFSRGTLVRLAASLVVACGLGFGLGQFVPDSDFNQPDAFDQLLMSVSQDPSRNGSG